jgi:hypothetical protein
MATESTEVHEKNAGEPPTTNHLIYLAKTQRSQSTIISLRLGERFIDVGWCGFLFFRVLPWIPWPLK